MKKLGLLNTSIITANGDFTLEDITLEQAKQLVYENINNLDSAIGHISTAEIMSTLLDANIEMNRQQFKQEPGQKCIVFKLNGRPEEGKIYTVEEINAIGYKFQLLTMKDNSIGEKLDILEKELKVNNRYISKEWYDFSMRTINCIRNYLLYVFDQYGAQPYPISRRFYAIIELLDYGTKLEMDSIETFINTILPRLYKYDFKFNEECNKILHSMQ